MQSKNENLDNLLHCGDFCGCCFDVSIFKNILIRGCVFIFYFLERGKGRDKDQCERETWTVCLWYAP